MVRKGEPSQPLRNKRTTATHRHRQTHLPPKQPLQTQNTIHRLEVRLCKEMLETQIHEYCQLVEYRHEGGLVVGGVVGVMF